MTNTYLPHVGGVARSVQTFSEEYRRLGHEALVVAPTFPEEEGKTHLDPDWVVRLPAFQQFNGSDFSVRLPLAGVINSTINDFEANIIHSHHPFLLGDTALRIAATKHVPVIFTHHTLYEEYTHYVPFDSPGLKQFAVELPTHYANLCDGVIAPSQSIADLIRKRGVVVPVQIVPTGVDVQAFSGGDGKAFRKKHNIPPSAFIVGHVGRLAPEKNLEYLARAVAGFLKLEPTASFLLVGGGSAEESVKTIFQEQGLGDRLLAVGKKCGPDLYDAYRAMNVFAFSSFSETQGMVVAEAMAANLPVVALDASGVREVVRHDRNGFLLSADSAEPDFAASLQRLCREPELRKRLREGARRTAQKFAMERCALNALDFYEAIRTETRPQRQEDRSDFWLSLLKRVGVEWDLLEEKARAAFNAFLTEDPENEPKPKAISDLSA